MEIEPLVSIVIVTWNRKEDILVTLQSIYEQSYKNFEIIVVDNASADGTIEAIEEYFPEVNIIPLETNVGASAGRNPGIQAAKGKIVFILDSDASVEQDTLNKIIEKFQSRSDIGAIACKVINAYTNKLDGIGWVFSERDKADQHSEFLSFSFSECGCAFQKEALERSGLFSESLFFGREGEELGLRIWDTGYKILYLPDAKVLHRISPDQRFRAGDREYYDLRNCLHIYLTRYPWWMFTIFAPFRIGASFVRSYRRNHVRQTFQALLDTGKQLPTLLKQRRAIRNETARVYIGLQRQHGPLRWDIASWLKYKA